MFKNVAAKFIVFAFDATTNVPKTGDAANITAYVSKDYGAVTVLADTSATEMDATNAPGYYLFDAAQGETNADCLMVSAKSATSNIKVIGAPAVIYTRPTTGWLAPATAGRTLVVDAAGLADANVVKVGPTGAGTAQTARDIGASVLLSAGTGTGQLDFTSGVVKANAVQLLGTAWLTPGTAGTPDVNAKLLGGTAQTGRDVGASVLLSSGTGTGQVKLSSGYVAPNWGDVGNPTTVVGLSGTTVKTATDVETDTQDIQARLPAALVSGRIDSNVGAMAANVMTAAAAAADLTTELQSGLATAASVSTLQTSVDDLPTNAELATALAAADDAVLAAIAALNNLSQANIRTALGMSSANMDTQLADLPTNAELATALAAADDAVLAAIAALNNLSQANVRTAVGLGSANLDTQLAAILAAWTTALTESYAADGAAPTPAQALFLIMQSLHEFAISGTTRTVKKLDGSSTAATFTLNDATSPTSTTRAS